MRIPRLTTFKNLPARTWALIASLAVLVTLIVGLTQIWDRFSHQTPAFSGDVSKSKSATDLFGFVQSHDKEEVELDILERKIGSGLVFCLR